MASVNKVILVGNLGREPEVRYSPEGAAMCTINLATTSQWKDRNTGDRREETEWHRVVFYNRLAEIAGEYLRKGRSIYVEGRLKTRKWQGQDGQDRYTTEIVAEHMQMLGGGREAGQGEQPQASADESAPQAAGRRGRAKGKAKDAQPKETPADPTPMTGTDLDDIPF